MKNTTLYIIGNGFDLAHGLPTSYANFKNWLHITDASLYREIDRYFEPPNGDFWSDVETSLGCISLEYIENTIDDNDPREHPYAHMHHSEMEEGDDQTALSDISADVLKDEIAAFHEHFIPRLVQWVTSHPRPSYIYKDIFFKDSLFLSFNYTHTLLSYGINKNYIAYIHGEVGQEYLIMGHSGKNNDISTITDPNTYDASITDNVANALGYLENTLEVVDEVYHNTIKNTEQHIKEHADFFEKLATIQDIYILGHSLNDIDQPYFQKIAQITNKNKPTWHVVYYIADKSDQEAEEKEKARICTFLQDIIVDPIIDLIESTNYYKETMSLNSSSE